MSGRSCPTARVDEVYGKHAQAFSELENIFFNAHAIPREITRDAIKQRILGALNRELFAGWLSRPRGGIASFGLHLATMACLIWRSLQFPGSRGASVDILFDAWSPNSADFYGGIISSIHAKRIGAFGPYTKELSGIADVNKFPGANHRISLGVALSLFRTHFGCWRKYRSLSKMACIDIHDLALRLCLEVAIHLSCIVGISAKVLISANDNGYSPYRYWLYRANGVNKIFLIQNGARVELAAYHSSYIHCDYYFGWSWHRLKKFTEMRCGNKIPIGSSRLTNFLATKKSRRTTLTHDVLFIEQVYGISSSRHFVYMNFLRHLVRYASERPWVRVAYCCRPLRAAEDAVAIKSIDAILGGTEIVVLEANSSVSSYEKILNARVVAACDSSLRFEAVLLGKMILSCSDRVERFDYIVQDSDPHFVVSTDKYEAFSDKLDFLLDPKNADNNLIALNRMKGDWMSDQAPYVPDKIAEIAMTCC